MTTFYSEFFNAYDGETAKNLGIIYTPTEIVDFIIKGIDFFVIDVFGFSKGLVDESLYSPKKDNCLEILEPSAGTMAFLEGLILYCTEKIKSQYDKGDLNRNRSLKNWINDFFSKHVSAVELMPVPFLLGYFKIQTALKEIILANKLENIKPPEKFQFYIKNFLEYEPSVGPIYPNKKKIQIILGNPPYNINTQNRTEWIRNLVFDYKKGNKEKNLKILSDDYIKFIRQAQWKIEQMGRGIVAFITNNNFLDGTVFKIMRKSLVQAFDQIYIVDLHAI